MSKRWDEPKDPEEVLDYVCDWAAPLAGDTIVTSTWTVPDGLSSGLEFFDATTATIWLSGGELDADYELLNHITTAGGRTREQTCVLKVRAK